MLHQSHMSFAEFCAWVKRTDSTWRATPTDYAAYLADCLEEEVNAKFAERQAEQNKRFEQAERDD